MNIGPNHHQGEAKRYTVEKSRLVGSPNAWERKSKAAEHSFVALLYYNFIFKIVRAYETFCRYGTLNHNRFGDLRYLLYVLSMLGFPDTAVLLDDSTS